MVRRSYNIPDDEPNTMKFELPSQKEHLLQIVDVFTNQDETGVKFGLDDNTVIAKCEVVGGDEEGRTLLQRCSLDQEWKGFFATRLLLKAIGQDYKGKIEIDTDFWIGCQFYATVVHNVNNGKTYANIKEFNFDKIVEQQNRTKTEVKPPQEIAWDE
jgi:hypothetical protein